MIEQDHISMTKHTLINSNDKALFSTMRPQFLFLVTSFPLYHYMYTVGSVLSTTLHLSSNSLPSFIYRPHEPIDFAWHSQIS